MPNQEEKIADSVPAEVFHWTEFLSEELEAREWSWDLLTTLLMVERNKEEWGRVKLELDLWRHVGPTRKNIIFSEAFAKELGAVFGTSHELWLNLHATWMKHAKLPENDNKQEGS